MSQQNANTENNREDEVDLRKLFHAIGSVVINIGDGFVNLLIRLRRVSISYKVLLITMIIAGIISGIVFNKVSNPFYTTSMLISSSYFNTRLFENNIEKLNTLCEEEERTGLAELLNVEIDVAKKIKEFRYEPLVSEQDIVDIEVLKQKLEELKVGAPDIQKVIDQLYIQNKRTYVISLDVFDNSIIESLQLSIVYYFKNNPYVKNRIKTTKENRLRLISKLEGDLKQLDSLKNLFNLNMKASADRKGESATSNVYVGESGTLDPASFYNQSIKVFEELQSTETAMALGTDFEVRDSFTVFTVPESPSMKKAVVYSVFLFVGLGYLLILFIEINKYLSRIEKKRFQDLDS